MRDRVVEEQLHLVEERLLIGLDLQQILAAGLDDLTGGLLLAVQGVHGDRGAAQVQQLEQLG